ncbi:MAG: glycosyltransferase family 4 protein [Patescibacteria group bacterium]
MKILMITPYLPYPLVSGGQIRTYNLLKNLSSKHKITLVSFIREPKEKQYLKDLKPFCENILVYQRRKAWSPLNIILAAVTPYPFLVSIYISRSLRRDISNLLEKENFDLIHAETFYVMPNIPQTNVPIFLVEQVIEYLVYQRFVEGLPSWFTFLKPFLKFDVAKIKWWEKHYWTRAKRLAAMSQDDKNFIEGIDSSLKVDVVANGVDIHYFANIKKQKTNKPTILFVGNFKWLPNRDAAQFLVKDIWPLIKSQITDARLWIVGRNPTPDLKNYASGDISIDEGVGDIRTAYGKSDVLLAPIRNGRGTKYKILEAMATKTAIVGTPLATEGINIINNKHALIGESAKDLAEKTIRLLKNHEESKTLAQNAYELVATDYNWKKISNSLDKVYREVGAK